MQLAATKPDEAAWAAALVEARGADFVDINFGCPIDYFTRKGLGASIGRQPNRGFAARRGDEGRGRHRSRSPRRSASAGTTRMRNYLQQAQAAVDGGADALFVHGRTRNARYRFAADWDAIGEIAAAVPVPVIGNGDLLFPHEIDAARAALRLRRRDGGARGADQAVDLPRSRRRLLGHHRRRALATLSALRDARARALGRRRARVSRACGRSSTGISTSGAATSRAVADGTFPTMQRARRRTQSAIAARALLARGTTRPRGRVPAPNGRPGAVTRDRPRDGDARHRRDGVSRMRRTKTAASVQGWLVNVVRLQRPVARMPLLEFLQRSRPVAPSAAATASDPPAACRRSGTSGSSSLRCRVANALHRRAAHRTRLAVAAVHGHPLAKRRDLLRETPRPLRRSADRRQSVSVPRSRSCRRAISSSVICAVSFIGDIRAACRISSE